MLISLYGSPVLEMGLFYSRVLKATALLVKEIKVGEHLPIAYESNAHVPCLRPFCAQSWDLEMVQSLGVHTVGFVLRVVFGNGSIAGGS